MHWLRLCTLASLLNDVIHKRSKEAGDIQHQHANLKSKLCDISIHSDFDMIAARLHDLAHDVLYSFIVETYLSSYF